MSTGRTTIRVLAGLASIVAAAMGAVSLTAWWIGGWRLARLGPDGIPMGPNTSLLFIILGLSAAALLFWPESRGARRLSLAAAAATFTASGLAAVQWLRYFPLPWDSWLLGSERVVGAMPLGRMSPLTTIAFLLSSFGYAAVFATGPKLRAVRLTGLGVTCLALIIGLEVVASYAAGTPRYYGGSTTPMAVLTAAAFALVNFTLLWVSDVPKLLSRWLDLDASGRKIPFRRREIATIILLGMLVAFASLLYLRRGQDAARNAAYQQLDAIASLKAAQISSWRNERLGEARFLRRTRAVALDTEALIARPEGPAERARLADWLEPLRGGTRYESAMMYDVEARLLLALPAGSAPEGISDDVFQGAISSLDAVVGDLHRREDGSIYLDLVAPIRSQPRRGRRSVAADPAPPAAIAVLRLDPGRALFPMIREWPVPTVTAEALLVRREGSEVVFLSELRHFAGGPMTLRLSIDDPYLPEARGLRGQSGVLEGLDYRGVAVLATSRRIPDSPWVLIAKIDQAEAYGPIRREARLSFAMVGLLLLSLGLASSSVLRQRQATSLRRALSAEQERNLMAERLALITRHANDIILLTDRKGRVLEANDRALEAYGYTLDEIRALPPGGLRPPESAGDLGKQLDLLESQDGAVFETLHRRRQGTTFPVEVSARAVTVGGRGGFLFVTRDTSQRKEQQAEIERLSRLRAAHSQVNQAIVHADSGEALLNDVCRALVEAGPFLMAWVGLRDAATGVVSPAAGFGDQCGYLAKIRVSADDSPEGRGPTGTAIRENRTVVCEDFLNDPAMKPWRDAGERCGFRASVALPVRLGGVAVGALSVYVGETGFFGVEEIALLEEAALDVSFGLDGLDRESRRRQAEAVIRESEERLRLALRAGHQGLYDLNVQTGEATTSPEYATMLGYDPASFRETNALWIERLHQEDREPVSQAYADYVAGRTTEYRVEFRQRTVHGDWKWILSLGQIVERDSAGAPLRMLGTHTDITRIKQAEASLSASLREKEALLKEVHHRVKNNLQVITSLLRLEASRSEPSTRAVLKDMQGRIRSMALLHETLYRSGNFARVDLADYLRQLATQLFRVGNPEPARVLLVMELESVRVDIDQAIPCGLIVNELLTNSLKYGFVDGRSGEVRLGLGPEGEGRIRLRVADTGAGLPQDFDVRRGRSLGLQLVADLVRQIAGELEIEAGPGASFTCRFTPHSAAAEGPSPR